MEEEKNLAEQTEEKNESEVSFEELIQGRYKADFDERVQRILDKRLRGLRQENQRLTREREQRCNRAKESLRQLIGQQEQLQTRYPGFDWQKELRNPAFGRLITAGVDAVSAYETVHRRELLRQAMSYAAQRSREQTVQAVASGGKRVRENRGRAGSVSRSDPGSLTGEELAAIRKRVFDGEKIRF